MRAAHFGAARADAREVVAHAAAAPHGLGGFAQRFVDAGEAFVVAALDAVAHRLHEAVDQRGVQLGAGGAHDAAGADGARVQVLEEALLPLGAAVLRLDAGQRLRDALEQVLLGLLAGVPTIIGAWIGGFTYSPGWTALFFAIGAGAIAQVLVVLSRLFSRDEKRGFAGNIGTGYFPGVTDTTLIGVAS